MVVAASASTLGYAATLRGRSILNISQTNITKELSWMFSV